MKILVIGHAYIAPINQEKWKTFARLNPHDQVTVIFPMEWHDQLFTLEQENKQKTREQNCTFIGLPASYSGLEIKYTYKTSSIIKLLKEIKPDIIYVEQGDSALSYFQVIMASILFAPRAKRLFFTWINWKPKISLKHKLFFGTIGKINRFFSHGAIVGNYDAQVLLEEKKFTKPILVLPQLGIDLEQIPHTTEQNNKTIGFVGRLVPEKGIFDLLNAFYSLHQTHPDWHLVFVGTGPSKEELQKKIKALHLETHVTIKDPVPHEQIFTLLHKIEILVLPSYDVPTWREQFGHILIEAMALKIPVIGSTGGEIPNVIGNAGSIFTQRNISDLASKISTLIQDETLRKELGKKGLERVKQEYSHEIIAQKSKDFLAKLLSK
jgi:glycosyltransferase involved in cell wall biosynthesis